MYADSYSRLKEPGVNIHCRDNLCMNWTIIKFLNQEKLGDLMIDAWFVFRKAIAKKLILFYNSQ